MVVVRHSYLGRRGSGGSIKAIGKAIAHVKYIENRPGPDKEKNGRDLFNDKDDRIDTKELKEKIKGTKNQRVNIHKLTLAPEINPKDKKAFTREVMSELGSAKGYDLEWAAVAHTNTDHHHIHVVVMGKDRNGTDVLLDLKDIKKVREYGDRYLEREHPRELEKSREEREQKKKEKQLKWQKNKEQRKKQGLELPWMHKKIVREQLQPYEKWREQQDKNLEQSKDKTQEKQKNKIKAFDKEYSKDNSLKELRALDEKLWDNFDERIPKKEYKKLSSWIKEKEIGFDPSKQKDKKDKPFIEFEDQKYRKSDSYEKLTGLSRELRESSERLPFDDYKKLRGWIEDKDRSRWAGALEKGLAQAKSQMKTPERPRTTEVAGGRMINPMQQQLMKNPVVGLFMVQAGITSELVRSIELTDNRDRLKEGREELEKGSREIDEALTKDLAGTKYEEKAKGQKDKIDKALDETKEVVKKRSSQTDKDKEKQEREKKDREWFERGGGWGR